MKSPAPRAYVTTTGTTSCVALASKADLWYTARTICSAKQAREMERGSPRAIPVLSMSSRVSLKASHLSSAACWVRSGILGTTIALLRSPTGAVTTMAAHPITAAAPRQADANHRSV